MKEKKSLNKNNKLHVFIADDDPEDIDFFRLALHEIAEDVKLTVAKNGLELLDFLKVVLPDIIFLDINMPAMNGLDCLAEIRRHKDLDKVPVIIYSTSATQADIYKSYILGANRYIKKPAYFDSIKKQLAQTLALNLRDLSQHSAMENYLVDLAE
jgi:CheY-like chemotaxis protein